MTRKVAIFQHIASEPAGYFESFFKKQNISFEYIRLFETGEVPEIDATHFLFMGGPMSVNDETELPYLRQEKALIRNEVQKGNKILGICLGAQLIASAFGARVYPYRQETGWVELTREEIDNSIFSQFPSRFYVFQLHGETFDLPPGAQLISTGNVVKNQAFSYKTALGLQFHLELNATIIEEWIQELDPSLKNTIMAETNKYLAKSTRLCRMIAEQFIQ